jgi:solute carrier family 39 (zinc transporter), member 1/2/3
MLSLKLLCIGLIFATSLLAGYFPLMRKIRTTDTLDFPIAESFVAGVFLGAGLIHMLGEASRLFFLGGYHYPTPFVLAGITFLILLVLEHIGREFYRNNGSHYTLFAIITLIVLSIHSLLTGIALGVSDSYSILLLILFAILAHKWAASFALALKLRKSPLSFKLSVCLFITFALMTPLGIGLGSIIAIDYAHNHLLVGIFCSMAAGTFLYLGTLHGLNQAIMVEDCFDLRRHLFIGLGFIIMAVTAIWL